MNDEATEIGEDDFFVRRRGKVEGPWSDEKLRSEVKLRRLSRFHEVSTDGSSWQRAEKFDWLFPKKTKSKSESDTSNEMPPEVLWFLSINEAEAGPFTETDVLKRIAKGIVGPSSLSWRDGFAKWIPLGHCDEFSKLFGENKNDEASQGNNYQTQPGQNQSSSTTVRKTRLSTASLVLGILAFPVFQILGCVLGMYLFSGSVITLLSVPAGILAIIFGYSAIRKIDRSNGTIVGRGKAASGAVLGAGATIGTVLFFAIAIASALI